MRDVEAGPLLDRLPEDERFSTWHLALRDGSLVGRGAGGVELMRAMALTRPVGRALALLPTGVLDAAYEVVARSRGTLGRAVPDRPGPRRYP